MSIWHREAHLRALGIGKPDQQPSPVSIPSALHSPIPDHDVLHDHAQDVLQDAPISEDQKAELWDHYHDTKSARELAERIQSVPIPEPVAVALLEAKKKAEPPQNSADKILGALVSIPKVALDTAEQHPHVLAQFVKAIFGKD